MTLKIFGADGTTWQIDSPDIRVLFAFYETYRFDAQMADRPIEVTTRTDTFTGQEAREWMDVMLVANWNWRQRLGGVAAVLTMLYALPPQVWWNPTTWLWWDVVWG